MRTVREFKPPETEEEWALLSGAPPPWHLYAVALADEMSRRRALGGPNSAAREWSRGELREIRERAAEVARVLGGGE